MTIATLILLSIIVITILLLKFGNKKQIVIVFLCAILLLTFGICIAKPVLHKPVSVSVIDYLVKFNTDGSMTTVKQTTTTKVKEKAE
jgi:hypothetical protein